MRCETLVPAELARDPAKNAFTVTGCEMLPIP
jgi:hypothetical protein